jgi:transglutaminase-like putative cysteine protease
MRLAAKGMAPLRIATFSFALSAVSVLDLKPERADPLGEFRDSVRYRGTLTEGASVTRVTSWLSPSAGQVKQIGAAGGLIVVTQRAELNPPESFGPSLFEWTLRRLPQTPFLAWRDEFRVSGLPDLAETPQQKKIGPGEYLLSRAAPPSAEEARQPPCRSMGDAGAEDSRCLADSPLLGLGDPAVDGLIARLNAERGATRWELACLANTFVFELIRSKGLEVGFAPASDVALNPSGDCTEHTVLMVALLRRLGVPARAALGWAALDVGREVSLGLHSWVEAKIGGRWIPFDPTFGQSPAGAFRVTSGVSDLASIADLAWDMGPPLDAGLGAKAAPIKVRGGQAVIDDVTISVSNGSWHLSAAGLFWEHPKLGLLLVSGNIRTLPAEDAKNIHVPGAPPARYTKSLGQLAMDCGKDRWLYIEGLDEGCGLDVLRGMRVAGGGGG